MPRPENPGSQGDAARNKPNKGQDENIHTFVAPDGSTIQATMRQFRNELRDQGYVKQDDVDNVPVEPETPVDGTTGA